MIHSRAVDSKQIVTWVTNIVNNLDSAWTDCAHDGESLVNGAIAEFLSLFKVEDSNDCKADLDKGYPLYTNIRTDFNN